jgi:hypothetical protein
MGIVINMLTHSLWGHYRTKCADYTHIHNEVQHKKATDFTEVGGVLSAVFRLFQIRKY